MIINASKNVTISPTTSYKPILKSTSIFKVSNNKLAQTGGLYERLPFQTGLAYKPMNSTIVLLLPCRFIKCGLPLNKVAWRYG